MHVMVLKYQLAIHRIWAALTDAEANRLPDTHPTGFRSSDIAVTDAATCDAVAVSSNRNGRANRSVRAADAVLL